ncbi:cutinase family protein [bacterium]|nr:cutinase family protein [bacterium]NDD84453.1 cutinase family protein [bacterium]NDG30327.1 cutinase family protein [bacterium]
MKHKLQSITGVALSATFLFATMLMAIPTKALNCKNLNVIFMRGSSQNYSPHNGEDVNFPTWYFDKTTNEVTFDDYRINTKNDDEPAFVTKEKEAAKYFKAIGDRVHADFPALTMQFVSLHDIAGKYNGNGYRAVSAFGPWTQGFVSQNAIGAKFSSLEVGEYNQSVQDGAEELAGYLQDQMTSCPSQYNVVGGFSQGAHVVGEAMRLMHQQGKDNLLSRLGHVDLYGDPKFNGFDLATGKLNPLQVHTTMPWTRGDASQQHVGSLGARKPYVPDVLTSKTTSWCGMFDIVCGGIGALNAFDAKAHSDIYQQDGGFIEKSANEIYIDLKTRLALLAGLTDTSANSPLAYWNGIKHPKKIDVMFVMDRTGDETLSLSPEADYLARNFEYLAASGLSSIYTGLVTYTEFARFDGTKDVVESYPKTITNLTSDIYGDYSYFKSSWGPAHSQNPPRGGEDLQDSPFSAINMALDQNYWRPEARKVIVLFSNTWGKESEDSTTHTVKSITSKARSKDVEILPIFTSKTFRENPSRVEFVPTANAYWNKLAKATGGHYAEVSGSIYEKLVYDVIMGHVSAPDIEITTGKIYNKPSTTTKKVAQPTITKNTKPVFKKGKNITLSAAKSNAPKSKVTTYAWDVNGDGVTDVTSSLPDVTFTPDAPYDGAVTVTVTDQAGNSTTGTQDIQVTDDDSQVTYQEPVVLPDPVIQATRSGADVVLSWTPAEGTMAIMREDGSLLATADALLGTFTVQDAPTEAFTLKAQLINGNDSSNEVLVQVAASPVATVAGSVLATGSDPAKDSANGGQGSAQTQPGATATQQNTQPTSGAQQSLLQPASGTPPSGTQQSVIVAAQTPQVLGAAAVQTPTTPLPLQAPALPQKNNEATPTKPAYTTTLLVKTRARFNFSDLLSYAKYIFWTTVYVFWPNTNTLLVLLLLLFTLLAILQRNNRRQMYRLG